MRREQPSAKLQIKILHNHMKSFQDWLKEQTVLTTPDGPKGIMMKMLSVLSHLEPKDVEECKDLLFQLRTVLDDQLSGGY